MSWQNVSKSIANALTGVYNKKTEPGLQNTTSEASYETSKIEVNLKKMLSAI